MFKSLFSILFLIVVIQLASSQSYDDVVILVNSNSAESIDVGRYFQEKHNIIESHFIAISMPLKEVISKEEVSEILTQLNPILESMNGINYIVTTMGCPHSYYDDFINFPYKYSFESVIQYGNIDAEFVPVLEFEPNDFTFDEYGIYIVSRLEARTIEGTKKLIDRGGMNPLNNDNPLIIDLVQQGIDTANTTFNAWVLSLTDIEENLTPLMNVPIELDVNSTIHKVKENQSGYLGIIHGELTAAEGQDLICKTEGLAFLLNPTGALDTLPDLQLTPLDFLELNCHGAVGVVDEFYFTRARRIMKGTFSTYYDSNLGYNLGESFLRSHEYIRQEPFVLYGDPKSTVSFVSGIDNFIDKVFEFSIYPNPSNSFIHIKAPREFEEVALEIYTIDGKKVIATSINNIKTDRLDISHLPAGQYVAVIQTERWRENKIFIKQ